MAFIKPKTSTALLRLPQFMVGVAGLLLLLQAFLTIPVAQAATGINQQINFQGRLLNSSDVPMPDGNYNAQFKIYKDGDGQTAGDTTGSPAGTLLWTENHLNANSQGVQLINGYFSIQLGSVTSLSSVDFNQDTLWISLNFGNTNATCTPFSSCAGDGEMIPMKRLSANAYSMNSLMLGGLTASQFGQLAASNTFTGTNLIKTTSANALQVQNAGGNSVLAVDTSGGQVVLGQASTLNGQITFNNASNANTVTVVSGATGSSYTLTLPTGAATSNYCLTAGSVSGSNVPLTWASCPSGSTSSSFLARNTSDTSSAAFTGNLYSFTNTDTSASGVLALTGAGTGSALTVTDSGNPSAGNAVIVGNNTNATPAGNLLDLQVASSSKFKVDYQGNTTGGLFNGQTLSAAASFTGTVNATTGFKVNSAAPSGNFLRGDGTNFVSSAIQAGDIPAGSNNYIQNTTTVQAGANLYVRSAALGSVGAVIEGANGQTADLLDLNTYNGTSSTTVAKIDNAGNLTAASFAGNGANITSLNGSNISSGTVGNSYLTNSGALTVSPGTGLSGGGSVALGGNTTLNLANTSVTAASYGSASSVATFTVNAQGQLTTAASTPIAIATSQITSGNYVATLGTLTGLTTSGNSGTGSTPTLSVTYGSGANTAAQGNTSLSFTGSGNLTGTVSGTAGGGFSANTLDVVSNPTFTGLVSLQGNAVIGTTAANGTLSFLDGTTDGFKATLQTNGAITANRTIYLPDEAGTICLRNSSNCGFVSGSGSANFINNQTTVENAANFYIRSNGDTVTGILEGSNGQTADLLRLNTFNGTTSTTVAKFTAGGNLTFNQASTLSSSSGNLTVQAASTLTLGNSTSTTVSVQPAASGTLSLGTANANTIGIGSSNASTVTTIQGGGGVNIGTGSTANTIQIGTTASAIAQTINIGNNATASSTDTVVIGNLLGASSTTIQAGSGNINLSVNQSGAGVLVKTSTNNSTSAFQVQNSSGQKVLAVDTSANQILIGQSNQINGSLLFKDSADSNGITVTSTGATTNYTLTLPQQAPQGGLCVETSTGNASQLVFASCSNNNTSISEVQEVDANNTNTVNFTPGAIGDEVVLTTQIPTTGVTVTSISGGGISNWNKVITSANNATVHRVEMWVGTITALGSSPITVTYSSSPGAEEITATEFTAAGVNASTSWGVESANSQLNSVSSGTVTFPSATSVNGSELYVGYGQVQNPPATAGSTSGFNYIVTSTQHNILAYNTSLAANTAYQPTATQNSSGQSNTVEAVLTAFVTSTSINNTTTLQKANFYVQAASSGTVAGVLQAASSGTADIMNLRNASAVNVVTVGNTGNAVFKNSTDTNGTFQVQNVAGNSVFSVNTSGTAANNAVVLGKSSSLAGTLTFADPGDNNTISLTAPSTVAASYTLSLPSNTPTAGLCLGTSPSNATQLIFASCATQVSAAAITYVNQWSNNGTSVTTLADSPASVGNLLVFYSHSTNNVSITGISGGGVTNWTKVTSNVGAAGQGNDEMWRGVVTAAGSSTITATYSAAAGVNEIVSQEFTMGGSGGTWAVDTSGSTTGSSATINYPSLTPANSSELYTGYAWSANTMSAGSTSGFTYRSTSGNKFTTANTSVTGGSAIQPTATQSVSGNYNSIAGLIQAYAGTSVIVNSTATQQANFAVQAATSGTVAGMLQAASSGTADIFQAKDSSGNNIVAVNASVGQTNSGLTLGTPGTVGGQLNFAASGNTNIISILAPSAPGANYQLTLPTTTPAAGQCLATSPSNQFQLVFSSCANQVTSVAITFVNNWKSSTVSQSPTLSVSPANIGDLMTIFIFATKSDTVTGVSGGGVSTWTKIVGANSEEMWRGIVTSTGSNTVTVTLAGAAGPTAELAAQEWTTGSATGSWVVDTSGTISNTSSTTVTYPNLTPQSSKDLYVGYAVGTSNMSAGSTSGFTYFAGAGSAIYGTYNTTTSTTSQPTATQTSAGTSIAAGALIAAYSSSSVISNSTVTQEANFNIQAATPGSVAGTLQAFTTGTGDIADYLDGAGTLTDSFGSTGNFLVKPSSDSASAIQVQNSGGVNVLSVDTSAKTVVVGAGATGESSPSLLVVDNETGTTADPTELNGAIYYNATNHAFRCGVDGAWQNCDGLMFANTSNSSVNNNCSNNCAAFSTTTSVPANYCQPGRVIKLHATGFFSSQSSASNLQFGVYYGTNSTTASSDTLLGTLPPAATVTSASSNYFEMNFNILCFSTTTMQAAGILNIQTGTSAAGLTGLPMGSSSGSTVVSTSAKNLYIFPIWDTATTSNTATMTQFEVTGL